MLEQGEVLTLEDNKDYVVASSIMMDGINYVYLINTVNLSKMMFCSYDQVDGLYEVEDPETLDKIIKLFNENLNGTEPLTAEKIAEKSSVFEESLKEE